MDFMTAVRTCFSKYVDFSGRARRSEFWYFMLFSFLVNIVTSILDAVLGTSYDTGSGGLVNSVVSLALFLPTIAVSARRLHDTGRSGWWQVIYLVSIPVFFLSPWLGILAFVVALIVLIVWFCTDTHAGDNRFGPNPKTGPEGYEGGYPPPPPPGYGSGQHGG